MAEKQSKRQREETLLQIETEDLKRHKSYNQILSILEEEEEDEPTSQELSADILTALQNELSSSDPNLITCPNKPDPEPGLTNNNDNNTLLASSVLRQEDDEKERVIRHLLEASDDELGIPNKVERVDGDDVINGGDFSLSFGNGFWEFEDEAANYYTLLQSQLFM